MNLIIINGLGPRCLEGHPKKRVYLNASKKVLYDQVKMKKGFTLVNAKTVGMALIATKNVQNLVLYSGGPGDISGRRPVGNIPLSDHYKKCEEEPDILKKLQRSLAKVKKCTYIAGPNVPNGLLLGLFNITGKMGESCRSTNLGWVKIHATMRLSIKDGASYGSGSA